MEKNFAQTQKNKSIIKDLNAKKLRKFCRAIERNMNNFASVEKFHDSNRSCTGFFLKIDSVNGIRKQWKNGQAPKERNFYLRFYMTFFNQKTTQFFGSTYKSPLLKIKFSETGHYELSEESLYVYFLANSNGGLNSSGIGGVNLNPSTTNSNINIPQGQKPPTQCIIEVVFVETNLNNYVLSQSCEGWGILEIKEDGSMDTKPTTAAVYLGTPRSLLNKNSGMKNLYPIGGASIIYSCSVYKELEHAKFLLPNYVILGYKEQFPGVLMNYLPKKPILNEPLKLVEFSEIYLKNVEIEVSPNLESRLIYFASMYRKQKYEITDDSVLSPIIVKERKIRCGVHNTWTFINSSGLENFVSLTRRENYLFFKGVHPIDNYFNSENCAFILELNYTLSLPGPKNQREDILSMVIGYSIIIPEKVDMDNNFRSANLITGPGVTIYGEHLYDPIDQDDKVIRVNFVLSKNKDNFDKTYKEKEIEDLRGQMEVLKKSMMEDYNKMLMNKDKEKEDLLKKREVELEEMENKLRESQRGLRTIYDREDIAPSKTFSETYNPQGKSKTVTGFNNQRFMVDEQFEKADENMLADPDHSKSNIKYITDPSNQNNHSINQIDDNFEKELRRGSKKLTSNFKDDQKLNNMNNLDYDQENNEFDQELKNKFEHSKNVLDTKLRTNTRYDSIKISDHHGMAHMNNLNYNNSNYEKDEFNFYKLFYLKFKKDLEYDKNREEEMKKHLPKIIYDQSSKDISRSDKADLIARGLLSLDTADKSESVLNFTLEKELKDDKKAHSFTFQFVAFKPNSDIKDYTSIPDKIFFRFNFWDFEYFSTNVANVCKPSSSNINPSSTPLILQRENSVLAAKSDEKEMKVQIDYDPSTDPYTDYKDFISFLLNKQLFIEIYEAEKLFFLGYIKVPLRDLLRQGKPSIYLTKEYEIYDQNFARKGYLQVLLKSVGVSTHKAFIYDSSNLKVINTKDRFNSLPKKKKVRSKPLDINKIQQQEKEYLAKNLMSTNENSTGVNINSLINSNKTLKLNVDSEMQKRLRAMKYVNQSANPIIVPEEKIEQFKVKQEKEDQFYKTLNYANRLKEMKKKEILSKVMQDNNKNSLVISLIKGQPFFTNFIIHNNTEHDELLHLHISKTVEEVRENSDPNENLDTVTIINNSEEWKNITEKHLMIKPNDYNSISPQNYLVIKPNESIPILLKLLSYDENVCNSNYCVYVTKKSGEPLYYLSLTIVKVFPLIDHVFRYLLPEGRYATVKIPNPFKYDKMKVSKVLDNYICTDVMMNLQLDPSTNDFFFKTKVQPEGHKSEFYLFLYMDSLRSSLYSTWKFELTSIAAIDIHAQIGTKITQKLTLEAERTSRTVQFFSNNNEILYFTDKCNSPIILVPNMTNEIKYIIYPKKEENYEVVINCVDISNRELIKSWMVRIMPDKPQINHVHKIDCRVNSVTNIKYEFTNSLNSWVIFNFESNNPEILNFVDSRLPFNAGEKKLINISIPPQNQMGRAEVLVFVSETEETYSETILFQLNYK